MDPILLSPETRKKKEKTLIFLCWLIYTVAYLARYSFNANITLIEAHFGVLHSDAGLISTAFFIAYGAGQVINGIFCRRYPKRIVLAAVLLLSAAINLSVFLGMPFAAYKYLWFANGALQSVLWSSLISILSRHLSERAMQTAVVVMSTTTSIGTFLAYGTSALFSLGGDFRFSFLLGACVPALVGLLWFVLYPKTKSGLSAFLPAEENTKVEEKQSPSVYVASIPLLLGTMAFFAVVVNLTKDGLQTWVPSILKESFGLPDSLSIILTVVLPVIGIFGAILVTTLYRKIPNFIMLAGLFFLAAALSLFGSILLLQTPAWWAILLLFGILNLLMHGVNNIITSLMPLSLRNRLDSGKVAGVLNGFCYVGSAISAYLLGFVADATGGWSGVFWLLFAACVFAILLFLIVSLFPAKNKNVNNS